MMKALLSWLAALAAFLGGAAHAQVYVYPYPYATPEEPITTPWQSVPGYREGLPGYGYPDLYGGLPLLYSGIPGYLQDPYGRRYRDRDRDGVPDHADNDRDGDGIPNSYDARPNDPRRR